MYNFLPVLPEGNIIYTEVTSFLDKRHATINIYKSIETFGNETISLSGKHLIYGRRKWTEIFKPMYVCHKFTRSIESTIKNGIHNTLDSVNYGEI